LQDFPDEEKMRKEEQFNTLKINAFYEPKDQCELQNLLLACIIIIIIIKTRELMKT
jgi:hypothetical protein